MIYSYNVKHNGIFYNAGENVPIENDAPTAEENELSDKGMLDEIANSESIIENTDDEAEKPAKRRYTKRRK